MLEIDPDPGKFIAYKIILSDIIDDIQYTPLDNTCPIGRSLKLRIVGGKIYLSIRDGIVQFEHNGKFLRKIGRQGRGPGEYSYGWEFAVDELSGNIFVSDYGKIKVYSPGGVFLRDIHTEKYGDSNHIFNIEVFNSLIFIPDFNNLGNSEYNWVFIDTLGMLVSKKENSAPKFLGGVEINGFQSYLTGSGNTYRFGNRLFYYNYFNDTIFAISSDLSYQGIYLFAGDNRLPKEYVKIASSQLDAFLYKTFIPYSIFETNQFLVFLYEYQNKSTIAFIDKKNNQTFEASSSKIDPGSFKKAKLLIINDFDGGLPLANDFKHYSINGEGYIAAFINPIDLKQYVSSSEFKNIVPKYPEKKESFRKMAESVNEMDNPILVTAHLKK
ncbi:MAG: 6-bladed beta-propeller [Methanosarcina sp.]